MTLFVGAERLRQLTELTDLWDEACAQRSLRIVVLRGAARSGRTEFIRRFYGQCALTQVYWPRELRDGDSLFPVEFTVSRDTSIPYLWWALDPHPGGFALLESAPQVTGHVEAIRDVVARADTVLQTRLRASLQAALLVGSLLPLGQIPSTVVNVIDAGVNLKSTTHGLRQAFTPHRTMVDLARSVPRGTVISIDGPTMARQAAEAEGLSHARLAAVLPYAIVVDNAENLDVATIEVLKSVSRHEGVAGVVLLAINTDLEPTHGPYAGNAALATWLNEQLQISRRQIREIELGPLTEDESTILVREILSQYEIDASQVERERLARIILASGGNPGRLGDLLHSRPVRRSLTHSSVDLPDLDRITRVEILNQALADLPEAQQIALCTIALHGPVVPQGWLPKTIAAETLEPLLGRWVNLREEVIEFASRETWKVANVYTGPLSDDEEDSIIQALSSRITVAQSNDEWSRLNPTLCESLLLAVFAGLGIEAMPADQLIDLVRRFRSSDRAESTTRIIGKLTLRLADSRPTLHEVVATSEALWDAGRTQAALDSLQASYDAILKEVGPGDSRVIPFLANLATTWASIAEINAGHPGSKPYYERAEHLIRKLYSVRKLNLPSGDPGIPDTLMQLARLHGDLHHPAEAIQPAIEAIKLYEQGACLGPDHPIALSARESLARWYAEINNIDQAITEYGRLVVDCKRIFGDYHEATLTARLNVAYHGLRTYQPERYLHDLEKLIEDRALVYGNDHARTLTARSALARYYWINENYRAASRGMAEVAEGREKLLGPDHPQTLTARGNLAQIRADQGDLPAAIATIESVILGAMKTYGPTHPETLALQIGLAHRQAQAGLIGDARSLLNRLIPTIDDALGRDHPHSVSARAKLAFVQSEASEDEEAVATLRESLQTMRRVLPPDHPDLLKYRFDLVQFELAAGDAGRSKEELVTLVPDLERLCGPHDIRTLKTRFLSFQVDLSCESNGWTDTIQTGVTLLRDTAAALGPDHPHTLVVRRAVVFAKAETAESIDESLGVIRRLITDMEGLMFPDRDLILDTRDDLASWLARKGESQLAIDELTALERDIELLEGSNDPRALAARFNLIMTRQANQCNYDPYRELRDLFDSAGLALGVDHSLTQAISDALAEFRAAERGE